MNYKPLSNKTKWLYIPELKLEQQAQVLATKYGKFIVFAEHDIPFSSGFKKALVDIGFLQYGYHGTQAFVRTYSKESAKALLTLPAAQLLLADTTSIFYSKNKENSIKYIDPAFQPKIPQEKSLQETKIEPKVQKISSKNATQKQKDSSDLLEFLRQESKKMGILETSYIPKAEEYFKIRKEAIDNTHEFDEVVNSQEAKVKSQENLEYQADVAQAMKAYQEELKAEEENISGIFYEILDEVAFTDENIHHTYFSDFDLYRESFSQLQRLGQNFDALVLAELAKTRELRQEEKRQLALFSGWGAIDSNTIENLYYASHSEEIYYKEIVMALYAAYLSKSKTGTASVFSLEDLRKNYGHYAFFQYLDENFNTIFSPEVGTILNASILNSHFTDISLCNHLWKTVKQTGFEGGYILEPATGHGHILGTIPQDILSKSKIVGIEKEIATYKIAQALFPDAQIFNSGFESIHVPKESFDCIVSNVPFGNYSVYDPVHNQKGLSIHDYFIVKSLASLKAGGVGIFLTSKHTLDSAFRTARNEIAKYGHFVGAIRLPVGSHRHQAGTDVEIDVLFFIGKGEKKISEPAYDWDYPEVVIGEDYKHYSKSMYWTDNPENMLGACLVEKNRYNREEFVVRNTLSPEAYEERLQTKLAEISQDMARVRNEYLQNQSDIRAETKSETEAPLMLLSDKEVPLSLHEKQGVLYIANEHGILESLEKYDSKTLVFFRWTVQAQFYSCLCK